MTLQFPGKGGGKGRGKGRETEAQRDAVGLERTGMGGRPAGDKGCTVQVGFHLAGNEELVKTFENGGKIISPGIWDNDAQSVEGALQEEKRARGNECNSRRNYEKRRKELGMTPQIWSGHCPPSLCHKWLPVDLRMKLKVLDVPAPCLCLLDPSRLLVLQPTAFFQLMDCPLPFLPWAPISKVPLILWVSAQSKPSLALTVCPQHLFLCV